MSTTLALRWLKMLLLLMTALFASVVVFGNLTDYGSNYAFVQHVLSMDTTFEGNKLMWRAITSPALHTLAYGLIILTEAALAAFAWVGTYRLYRKLNADARAFSQAKAYGFVAYAVGLVLFFFGFIVVGSEWFAMWQSPTWNGKQTAMDIVEVLLGSTILLALPERELAE
ncbi:DUF2165 domain-containing protein [Archangium violaceum]|uniref:DUF2165 family protein n=1 Tax=Archangium violaceum TaxID=83451 RepID=UPI00193BD95E|nr:DUF2165 domain-containing protein [Archangium violaceum]QRK04881.1 DUF2165 domain-containing protein [Archangium violaceum]